MGSDVRKVGERGQVTIPQELRERFDIHGGDEVVVREEEGKIVLEKPLDESDVAEGYRKRAEQFRALSEEFSAVSSEADASLGDVPEW